MSRVIKKKEGGKREAEKEKKEELLAIKKVKKEKESEPEPEPEQISDSEEVHEDVSDEEEPEDSDGEDEKDSDGEDEEDSDGEDEKIIMTFNSDFEAYPPSADDENGIVNMLTQTFLRADIDLKSMAEGIIAKSPHGAVLTQAYDDEETEEDYMTYGLCTTLPMNEYKDNEPQFIKDIFVYLLNRAKNGAPSDIYKKIQEIQESKEGLTGIFVNERLLNFPTIVVPQIFGSLRTDMHDLEAKYSNIFYIQKLRIAESNMDSSNAQFKKKGKIGKAEKKRAAAAALANCDVEFDNPEDKFLFELEEGKEVHFDYPVHMDVEPGSKFHIIKKDGKKWNPFRRLVIMDAKRFSAFLKNGSEGMLV